MGGVVASACDDEGGYYNNGYWPNAGGRFEYRCSEYLSCGTCTPIDGCGWCQTGVGEGMCVADPNECAGSAAFSWTWNPSGCFAPPVAEDAGAAATATEDAGTTVVADSGTSTTDDAGGADEDTGAPVVVH